MRISRDEMFIEIVNTVSKRSTCQRKQVGAILVKDGRIISLGYNGPPTGYPICGECLGAGCQISGHAESNALMFAAREGISTKGCTMYCTMSPCENCAKLILAAGITELVYLCEYRDLSGLNMLKQYADMKVRRV